MTQVRTRRLLLRPLRPADFSSFKDVRGRCHSWLTKWEPRRPAGSPDPATDSAAFATRCAARERERQLGTGYAFGVFVGEEFAGEINVNNVVRGAFQSGHVGYWVDEKFAGQGVTPEGLVGVFGFVFDQVGLHRLEIAIIPRNAASLRVVEKLAIRREGQSARYLEIDGIWEDHVRFGVTAEEWQARRDELTERHLTGTRARR